MELNNMQGVNAYNNPPGTTPPVDNRQLREQNLEASRTDLNRENTSVAQKAFEVSLTRDAQRLAAQSAKESNPTQTTTSEDQTAQNSIVQAQKKSLIVNIVA